MTVGDMQLRWWCAYVRAARSLREDVERQRRELEQMRR